MTSILDDDDDLVTVQAEESDNEEDIDDFRHSRMLESIGSLDGKRRVHEVIRSEPAKTVSEFHVTTTTDKVGLHELVGALKNNASHGELKKKLNRITKKKKVVDTPLPKGEQEKIQRVVAYEQTTTEVSKWAPIIEKNRKKEQLSFPLQKPDIKLQNVSKVAKSITPFTSLEMEVASLLQGSVETNLSNDSILTRDEEKALKAMSLEEAKERRAELQKYRALLSYRETKARRQNKIKSKKYHRVMRKEKDKKEKKRMEDLEKTDPELFLEELKKIDTDRMQERMSLKHRGGSKFMRRQKMYAKYDDKARQSIQDMVDKNKELTKKMAEESSSEEEEEEVMEETSGVNPIVPDHMLAGSNPWLAAPGKKARAVVTSNVQDSTETTQSEYSRPKALKITDSDVKTNQKLQKEIELSSDDDDDEGSSFEVSDSDEELDIDQLFDTLGELEKEKAKELNKEKSKGDSKGKSSEKSRKGSKPASSAKDSPKKGKQKKAASTTKATSAPKSKSKDAESVENEEEEEEDEEIGMSLSRKRTLEDMDNWSDEEMEVRNTRPAVSAKSQSAKSKAKDNKQTEKPAEPDQIDPKKFLTIENKLKPSQLPNVVDEEDDDEEHRMTISEAFASDDVVEEFRQEKRDLEEKEKVKDIDLSLPGWGAWGGAGIKPNEKKRKKFVIEAPKMKRKDSHLEHVIISEVKDKTISKHQVNKLPHYFRSVHQFESNIRAPIGKTWNPETSYREMIKPKVVTEMGKIIEPISKSEVFKKQQVKVKDFKETQKPEKDIANKSRARKPENFKNSKAKKSFSRAKSKQNKPQGGPSAKKQRTK